MNWSENNNLIKYEEKLPSEVSNELGTDEEEIRFWKPRDSKRTIFGATIKSIWRFFVVFAGFLAIFVLILMLLGIEPPAGNSETENESEAISAGADFDESTALSDTVVVENSEIPMLINETNVNLEIDERAAADYSLSKLFEGGKGVKVLVVHSHNSESVSENMGVMQAGEVLSQLLASAGISCFHINVEHDSQGRFAAYERMKDTVATQRKNNSDIVLVVDLHDSDSGAPITLTVGMNDDFGWMENFNLATAVCTRVKGVKTALRVVPDDIGQNNGLLTLHVGIGGNEMSDSEARAALSAIAMSLINICIKNSPTGEFFI